MSAHVPLCDVRLDECLTDVEAELWLHGHPEDRVQEDGTPSTCTARKSIDYLAPQVEGILSHVESLIYCLKRRRMA